MKFKLPVWNSVKSRPFLENPTNLELKQTSIKGLFVRKDKNFISYENDYSHMTPLDWKGFMEKIRNNKVNFIRENSKNVGDCLEVGAGDNYNLKFLKWKKFTICDPFLKSSERKNVTFIKGYFEKIKFKRKFDTIIMFSVLEHCHKYNEFIKRAKKNLKKNGKIFIEVPVIGRQFLDGDFNCLLHEHVNYFTKKGLFNLLKNNKLYAEKFYFKNDTAFLCIKHNKENKNHDIDEQLLKLEDYKKIFNNKLKNFRNFLKKNKGKKIVFYGANNGLNILFFSVKEKIKLDYKNLFITDSDKNKWGKYLGGFKKPINNPKIIKNCDIICITALSFADEILNNLKKNKQIIKLNEL